jgi:hypothetical protein
MTPVTSELCGVNDLGVDGMSGACVMTLSGDPHDSPRGCVGASLAGYSLTSHFHAKKRTSARLCRVTTRRCVFNFMLCPQGRSPRYPLARRLDVPRIGLVAMVERKIPKLLLAIEPRFLPYSSQFITQNYNSFPHVGSKPRTEESALK